MEGTFAYATSFLVGLQLVGPAVLNPTRIFGAMLFFLWQYEADTLVHACAHAASPHAVVGHDPFPTGPRGARRLPWRA